MIVHVPVALVIISNGGDDDEDVSDSSCASGLLLLVCPPPTQVCPAHSTDFHICSVSIRQKYTKKNKNKNTGDKKTEKLQPHNKYASESLLPPVILIC